MRGIGSLSSLPLSRICSRDGAEQLRHLSMRVRRFCCCGEAALGCWEVTSPDWVEKIPGPPMILALITVIDSYHYLEEA